MISTDAGVAIAAYAERVLPLAIASLGDAYRYQSLPLCIIDSVFSIGVRYTGTQRVVARYCAYTKQSRLRNGKELPPVAEQESISSFVNRPEQALPEIMADRVYGNRQRTSSRNGILKSDAAARFARCLRLNGVEYFQDIPRILGEDFFRFETAIKAIPGQRSGISLQYFLMLTGSEEFVKPDRMVVRFLEAALSRRVVFKEANSLMRAACVQLKPKYPQITPRLLDQVVWKYQRMIEPIDKGCGADHD